MVTPEEIALAQRLESIFMPYAAERRNEAIEANGRFVHYTSAEAGLKIISSKRLWMRSTTCMSDYREVHHGFDTLNKFFSNEASKQEFYETLNGCGDSLAEQAIGIFNEWWVDTQLQTYITSISEHKDSEDSHGRLSMWRAFGRTAARVALVFRLPLSSGAAGALNIIVSPVAYFTDAEFVAEISRALASIRENRDFLRTLDRQRLVNLAFSMILTAVTCQKHEGFQEEREWRVLHSPKRNPSPLIVSSLETIDGVPQLIYKLPIDTSISVDVTGIDITDMFDRVIIGPTPYGDAMHAAFVTALAGVGVKDPRVVISGIPIRT
jgi:hypothetical protein